MSIGNSIDLTQVQNDDYLAREVGTKWMDWNTARTDVLSRWKETTAYVYATSTRDTDGGYVGGFDEDGGGWSHSTHLPKITQIYDNLAANYMAALMPHDDVIEFMGFSQDAVVKEKRTKVEAYLKTKHRLSRFRTVLQQLVNDLLLYGNCFAQVYYVNQSSSASGVPRMAYSGPKVRVISPYDIVFNPLATSFERAPKIVRTIKTLGELLRDIDESPEGKYYAPGIEKWIKCRKAIAGMTTEDIDKYIALQIDGFGGPTNYFQSGNVEILELYGDIFDVEKGELLKNHVITVVDRRYVIRKEPLETWSGFPHIFHCGWRLRPNNLWAMGPLDNLVGSQYLINHLENSRADAFDQMLAPTRVIVGDVEEDGVQIGVPGGAYRIPTGDGSVSNLVPDTTVLQADMQILTKMQQMEEFAGSPKEMSGFRSPGEKTALEVNNMLQSAGRIFQHKLMYFEEEFLERIYNAELEQARENLNKADLIRVYDSEDDVVLFEEIIPEDLLIEGKLIPTGARSYTRKQQLAQNLMNLQQAAQMDPMLGTHFPSIKLAEAWVELLGIQSLGVLEPWGRIREQAEGARKTMLAQRTVQADQAAVGMADQEANMVAEAEEEILNEASPDAIA